MSIFPDHWIKKQALENDMITPFVDKQNKGNVISYGLSSYGYDPRMSDEFKVFTNVNNVIIDPKSFNSNSFIKMKGDYCVIPPNSFVLTSTIEYFKIPRDVIAICVGKSTYARCGIVVNVTPIEPESEGHVVLEFSNTTNLPVKLYANEGACQFLFFKANSVCNISYKDRKGKYMLQKGIVLPKV
jgi:dCTP deaminase